jgi:uncharacterized protein
MTHRGKLVALYVFFQRKKLSFIAILLILAAAISAQALEVPPKPKGRVSDYTSILTGAQIEALNRTLAEFENQTTNQIAVVLIPTLAGDSLEDYSIRLAEKWQVGQKGRDNGVILVIVTKDRKIRIEVGYGLEGVLPDSLAGDIIRQVIAPKFRQGRFFEGIEAGVTAIMAATRGEYRATGDSKRGSRGRSLISFFWPLVIFLIFLSVLSNSVRRRRYYSRRRGGWFIGGPFWWGGGGGGFSGGFGGGFSGGGGGFGGGGASGGW